MKIEMKTTSIQIFCALLLITIFSCAPTKTSSSENLYSTTWELEYISGPRIAFEGLYPDKKPKISFNKDTDQVTGNNSCNSYSADFKIDENTINFGEPGPSNMMYCGEGEKVFLNMMQKVNRYEINEEGKLNLMLDDVPMMRFKQSK